MNKAKKRAPVKVRVSMEWCDRMWSHEADSNVGSLTRLGRATALAGAAMAVAEQVISEMIRGGHLDD